MLPIFTMGSGKQTKKYSELNMLHSIYKYVIMWYNININNVLPWRVTSLLEGKSQRKVFTFFWLLLFYSL
ncbi:MAG: hypothetical protein K0R54_1626 [Clostridiaceae bacterium]|jgi:hypothetical protein|nr:hypothetical protein [Clostridiaceae bacterium]